MNRLHLKEIGQVREVDLKFGDLTVFVGPQASGKSIVLQWVKLVLDCGYIQEQMQVNGLDYRGQLPEFLDSYFGEGMHSIWRDESSVTVDGVSWPVKKRVGRQQRIKKKSVFLIPAQRVVALANGWPKPFTGYNAGDPYAVRDYSEELRRLMEREFTSPGPLFPRSNRMKADYRNLLKETVFADFKLSVDRVQSQRRLVLKASDEALPFMVWSAGQREFVPLLLGLYWLMPAAKISRRDEIEWVIVEEPEMGLHPRAIAVVLLLLLELLARGYRVCLSTHSPQVLELVWAMETLRAKKRAPVDLLSLFDAPRSAVLKDMASKVLQKHSKVYYFDPGSDVRDISNLDPSSEEASEASWGGLLEFSSRANRIVARAAANQLVAESPSLFSDDK